MYIRLLPVCLSVQMEGITKKFFCFILIKNFLFSCILVFKGNQKSAYFVEQNLSKLWVSEGSGVLLFPTAAVSLSMLHVRVCTRAKRGYSHFGTK